MDPKYLINYFLYEIIKESLPDYNRIKKLILEELEKYYDKNGYTLFIKSYPELLRKVEFYYLLRDFRSEEINSKESDLKSNIIGVSEYKRLIYCIYFDDGGVVIPMGFSISPELKEEIESYVLKLQKSLLDKRKIIELVTKKTSIEYLRVHYNPLYNLITLNDENYKKFEDISYIRHLLFK